MASTRNFCIVFLFLLTNSMVNGFPFPLHASCKIEWNFDASCDPLLNRVLIILRAWTGPSNCNEGGERCLYNITSNTSSEVTAVHESPKWHWIDDLKFNFVPKWRGGCIMRGFSTARSWFAIFDEGTNYCNLHNVVVGADLDRDPGYVEFTDSSICTQYHTADCNKRTPLQP